MASPFYISHPNAHHKMFIWASHAKPWYEVYKVGDMLLNEKQFKSLVNTTAKAKDDKTNQIKAFKNGINDEERRWPKGVVPYDIKDDLSTLMKTIIEVDIMTLNYMLMECINFRPARQDDKHILTLDADGKGCSSTVGMDSSGGESHLADICENSFIHEMIHVLGFRHEFTRPDRDKYIRVKWGRLKEDSVKNFLFSEDHTRTFGVPYNFYSLMHYTLFAFSKDKKKKKWTMEPIKPVDEETIRISRLPARSDLTKIRRMYQCHEPAFPKKCPWVVLNNGSVCVTSTKTKRLTFEAASKHCGELDKHGRLYEPWDYLGYKSILEKLKEEGQTMGHFWIGGMKRPGSRRPSYLSMEKIGFGFLDCRKFALACHLHVSREQCVAIAMNYKQEAPVMRMYPCTKQFKYICEIPEMIKRRS